LKNSTLKNFLVLVAQASRLRNVGCALRTNLAGGDARPTIFSGFPGEPQVHKQAGWPKKRADTQVRPYGKAQLFWNYPWLIDNHPK
jgi:hypothetical protein